MKKLAILLVLSFMTFLLAACNEEETAGGDEANTENTAEEEKLSIHTTVYPLQFFAEQIGGDTVDVQSILPPGSDPHTYEPTTKEMVEMAETDLFIYNGAGLEGYAEKISETIKAEGVTILEASAGIDLKEHVHDHGEGEDVHEESGEAHAEGEDAHEEDEHADESSEDGSHEDHGHGEQDPHIWLDPVRAVQLAGRVKDELVELDPEQKDIYEENFEQLRNTLIALDQRFHDQVEAKAKSKIIVSHAAYGYWEEAYGIEQIAVSGLSPTNEPSQKDLEKIIQVAEKYNLEYVIFEQNITPKVSEVVQKEIGAEPLRFHNLSVLTEQDLENEEDYFSLMNHNLDVLVQALSE